MSIKLADTLAPLADFPAAYAKDIEFDDGKNLQEKLNNGELGGGGGGFTPTTAQLDAMNSGINSEKVAQIATNVSDISDIQQTIGDINTVLEGVL